MVPPHRDIKKTRGTRTAWRQSRRYREKSGRLPGICRCLSRLWYFYYNLFVDFFSTP